jgi:hypothetical protein
MGRMRLVFYPFMVNRVIKIGRMIIKYWEKGGDMLDFSEKTEKEWIVFRSNKKH